MLNSNRVLIGIPVYDTVHVETCASLLQLYRNCKTRVQIRFTQNTYIHVARNTLLYQAISQKATHLMFIDSDMVFPADGLDRLIDDNQDIIGGLYNRRIEPHHPVIYQRINQELIGITDYPKNEIFEVDVIGTGFFLAKMEVFKKIEPPFFYYGEPHEFGLKNISSLDLGEDTTFCLNAKRSGCKIWCDPRIEIGHIGKQTF